MALCTKFKRRLDESFAPSRSQEFALCEGARRVVSKLLVITRREISCGEKCRYLVNI